MQTSMEIQIFYLPWRSTDASFIGTQEKETDKKFNATLTQSQPSSSPLKFKVTKSICYENIVYIAHTLSCVCVCMHTQTQIHTHTLSIKLIWTPKKSIKIRNKILDKLISLSEILFYFCTCVVFLSLLN